MIRFNAVPTILLSNAGRSTVSVNQQRLMEAQQEAATGRLHDVGRHLGARTSESIRLRGDLARLETSGDVLTQAKQRAGVTQAALDAINTLAANFMSLLSGARGSADGPQTAANAASEALGTLRNLLSTSYDGQFIFSGLDTEQAPLAPYDEGRSQAAISTAFLAHFGFPPDHSGVSSITGDQMRSFLDNGFAGLFSLERWTEDWSSAGQSNLLHSDPSGGRIDASSNANAPFARQLMQALSIMRDLGGANLSEGAFTVAVDKALELAAAAQGSIAAEQTRIGLSEQRITSSIRAIETRNNWIEKGVTALESVDPYEAAQRVNLLLTQLESSYAVTARINRMSLLSYL